MKNQRGMGLIEVLIASSILTVLMLGVANMMTSSAKSSHSIERSLGWDQFVATVMQNLNNPTSCTNMLKGVTLIQGKPVSLCLGGPNGPPCSGIFIVGGSSYGGMTIGKDPIPSQPGQKVPNPTPMQWRTVTSPPSGDGQAFGYFSIDANIQGTDGNPIVGGYQRTTEATIPGGFPVTATVKGNQIVSCSSGGSGSSGIQVAKLMGTVCATPHVAFGTCQSTIFWQPPFPNSSYSAVCSVIGTPYCLGGQCSGPAGTPLGFHIVGITAQTANYLTVEVTNGGLANMAQTVTVPEIDCIGIPQ